MGKITKAGQAIRGLAFKNRNSIWVGLGGSSPWPDDNYPIDEDVTATSFDEPLGYHYVTEKWMVVEDNLNGNLQFDDKLYRKIDDASAIAEGADNLYLKFEIDTAELTSITYRQVGIFFDLVPISSASNKETLMTSEVANVGNLIYVSNEVPRSRYPNTRHIIEVILPM